MDCQERFQELYTQNENRVLRLKRLLESIDKVEGTVQTRLDSHREHLETLRRSYRESLETFHTIRKNLSGLVPPSDDLRHTRPSEVIVHGGDLGDRDIRARP